MNNQELINFIKKSKEADQTREQIKLSLMSAGWQEADVDKELIQFFETSVPEAHKNKMLYPGLISSIIIVLIAAGAGAYYLINKSSNAPDNANLTASQTPNASESPTISYSPTTLKQASPMPSPTTSFSPTNPSISPKISGEPLVPRSTASPSASPSISGGPIISIVTNPPSPSPTTSNAPSENLKPIKIKLSDGTIITKNISQAEFDGYEGALSTLPASDKEKSSESIALPTSGYQLTTDASGREIKQYNLSQTFKFLPASDVSIVNVLTSDKNNVTDFSSFPLELTINYGNASFTTYPPSSLSIYFYGASSVCTTNGCGYYIIQPSQTDTVNKKVTTIITKPGQYLIGSKR